MEWQESQRDKTLAHRREIYRVWAARLAEEYGELVIGDDDYAALA